MLVIRHEKASGVLLEYRLMRNIHQAHLNPSITLATFFARLCSLPRAVIYMSFQLLGASLAGLMARASYGTRDFKVGGCWLFSDVVPIGDAFAVEFTACLALFFIAFGVGLDPRQKSVIPPALSPFLVGMTLGVLSWTTGYFRYGYGGASLNPARCFGTYVGSHMPGWHWHHWYVKHILARVSAVLRMTRLTVLGWLLFLPRLFMQRSTPSYHLVFPLPESESLSCGNS